LQFHISLLKKQQASFNSLTVFRNLED
jgi:hypothetical protein